MRIVVLAGGTSTERDVSISSGILVASALRQKGHEVVLLDVFRGYEQDICDVDALFKENYSFTDSVKVGETISDIDEVREERRDKSNRYIGENVIDICQCADITFLALHGGSGENGQVQAVLDLMGLKYTGSGYLGSALAMNKGITKSVLVQNKVLTPAGEIFKSAEEAMAWKQFPCVVKPCSGGSSVGITIAQNAEEYKASVKEAFRYGDVCPADITGEEDRTMRGAAEAAYNALRLESYARVDFILAEDGKAYCLEANTLPGMTPTSLLPQEAKVEGISYPDLCEKIIEISMKKYNK